MIVRTSLGERLWRVRKDHTWIDAQVRRCADGVEIDFSYDGARVCVRRFPTRDLAIDETNRTLQDLQRAGWTTHW